MPLYKFRYWVQKRLKNHEWQISELQIPERAIPETLEFGFELKYLSSAAASEALAVHLLIVDILGSCVGHDDLGVRVQRYCICIQLGRWVDSVLSPSVFVSAVILVKMRLEICSA